MRSDRLAAAAWCTLILACGTEPPANAKAFGHEAPVWRLGDALVTAGGLSSMPGHDLSTVRGGIILGADRMAVADALSREIRIFGTDDRLLSAYGGQGEGPGEFRSLNALSSGPEGTLCGWDSGLFRITCFDDEGGTASITTIDGEGLVSYPSRFVGVFSNGRSVFVNLPSEMDMHSDPTGPRRDTLRAILVGVNGMHGRAIATFPGAESVLLNDERVWGSHPVIFGRSTMWDLRDSMLVIGTNDSLEIRFFGMDGVEIGEFATAVKPVLVTDDAVQAARDQLLEDHARQTERNRKFMPPGDVARVDRVGRVHIEAIPHRETAPAFGDLQADGDGLVWLRRPCWGRGECQWAIVDKEGRVHGNLLIPRAMEVLDVSDGLILLLERGDLDVEVVRMHEVDGYGLPLRVGG